MKWCLAIVLVLTGVHVSRTRALEPQPERVRAGFWTAVSDPDRQRADALLQQARHELLLVMLSTRRARIADMIPNDWEGACKKLTALAAPLDLPGFAHKRMRILASVLGESMQRATHIENAIVRLREAEELAPNNPDVLHALGLALRDWERPGPLDACSAQRRDDEAIAVFERLRRHHPQHRPAAVAYDLAILYTRTLQFERAMQCYAEAAPLEMDTAQLPVLLSNWAEVTMLAGNLMDAVRLYQRAVELSVDRREYLLPLWGMAVALDRLGERESALEHVTRALVAEGGSMAILHSDGVFFEPESEIHYYEALGHEAASRMPDADVSDALIKAAASWRTFFTTGGDQTPWAASARDNLARIEQEIERRKPAEASSPKSRRPASPRR